MGIYKGIKIFTDAQYEWDITEERRLIKKELRRELRKNAKANKNS
jgi:hypothetical protein